MLHPVPAQQHYDRKVHLLLPVNAGAAGNSQGFCKTLLSAIVHGDEPTVVNWDMERDWELMQRMKVIGTQLFAYSWNAG